MLKKEDRIRRLIPLFEHGRMWFPASLPYTDSAGMIHDLVVDFVEQEMLAFPVGKHDDMLDSLARIEEPDVSLPLPIEEDNAAIHYRGASCQPLTQSMGM